GFSGVIMSDSLSMYGIGVKWSLPQAAVMALTAGNDMLLLGNGDPSYEVSAIAAVKAAVLSGRLDRTKLHDSAMRVNALRDRWGRRVTQCPEPQTACCMCNSSPTCGELARRAGGAGRAKAILWPA